MKILYIGNQSTPGGGSPTSIDTLAPLLRKEGYTVKTASKKRGRLGRLADMLFQVYKHRKDTSYVLIDTYSTMNFWYAISVGQLCQRLGLRYIPILHGGDLPSRLNKSARLAAVFFKEAHLNIAPSQFLQAEFQTYGIRNIKMIPNSIKIQDYHFKKRKEFRPKLLWVRAFAELYNPMLALQVLEILQHKHPDAELYMVGPEKDESMKICRKLATEKRLPVRFPGKVNKEQWRKMSTEFDIFLNTTNIENTPVSVIEAMALGLPVVSTDVGGMPFLIDHDKDGILVPPQSPVKMAEAVERLLENKNKAMNIATFAREKVEGFDWEKVKGQWVEVLSV